MLNIEKKQEGTSLTVVLQGRLDTTTSPELELSLKESLPGVTELVMDLEGLEYISSAGLRVLLSSHKAMMSKGGMKIVHVNDVVQEVFEVTGFSDILTIE